MTNQTALHLRGCTLRSDSVARTSHAGSAMRAEAVQAMTEWPIIEKVCLDQWPLFIS